MYKFGLLGHPVAHSVSPQMQNAGFKALGIQADYVLVDVLPENLKDTFAQLADDWRGWNVTIPHKEAAARLVDELDPEAAALGSVNTVVPLGNHRLKGYSTDGYGMMTALRENFGLDITGLRLCVYGTGGAGRAGALYAALHGAASLLLVNRTLERAETLAQNIRRLAPQCRVSVLPFRDTDAIAQSLKDCDVFIQSTSLGLKPADPLPFPPERIPVAMPIMDMVYGSTPFRLACLATGHRIIDGSSMLLHQGCRSFELWTNRSAPVAAMRQALDEALRNRH